MNTRTSRSVVLIAILASAVSSPHAALAGKSKAFGKAIESVRQPKSTPTPKVEAPPPKTPAAQPKPTPPAKAFNHHENLQSPKPNSYRSRGGFAGLPKKQAVPKAAPPAAPIVKKGDTTSASGSATLQSSKAVGAIADAKKVVPKSPGAARNQALFAVRKTEENAGIAAGNARRTVASVSHEKKLTDAKKITESKRSKIQKEKSIDAIANGRFTKNTEIRPGNGPGQTRAEYVRIKNSDGKTIRTYKDSYDRANNFQGRKPLTGGPEGRPKNKATDKNNGSK